MSEELKQRLRIAIADKEKAEELIAIIAALLASQSDFEARIAALENP